MVCFWMVEPLKTSSVCISSWMMFLGSSAFLLLSAAVMFSFRILKDNVWLQPSSLGWNVLVHGVSQLFQIQCQRNTEVTDSSGPNLQTHNGTRSESKPNRVYPADCQLNLTTIHFIKWIFTSSSSHYKRCRNTWTFKFFHLSNTLLTIRKMGIWTILKTSFPLRPLKFWKSEFRYSSKVCLSTCLLAYIL